MSGSSYFHSIETDIPASNFAAVAVSVLRKLSWADPFVHEAICWCNARKRHQEIIMNTSWTFDFAVDLNWKPIAGGCAVEISIVEHNYPSSLEQCKEKAAKIAKEITEIGAAIQNAPPATGPEGAQWEPFDQLAAAGYVGAADDSRSLIIAKCEQGFVRLSPEDTLRGALVAGPTGSGKSTGIFLPNLDERLLSSAIVTEATMGNGKADLYMKTAGYRAVAGHQIYYFNPDDLSSHRINPLDCVTNIADAMRVTEILMQSTTVGTHTGDQTWEMAERLLLTALILYAVGERPDGNGNIAYVLCLLNQGAEALSKIFEESHYEEAQQAYAGFLRNSTEAYRNLVAAGLITRLGLWQDPKIRALTATTDIDFAKLPQELFTVYLATPAHKQELKPLAALMFNLFLDFVCEKEFSYPLALFLDEFTNFGYVRGMPQKLSIIRHAGIAVVIGIQDYVQLELLYGKEASLFLSQPGTRIFFRPNDFRTAENISRGLGIAEENQVKVTSAGQLHENLDKKPLLSSDQLLAMDKSSLIVFTPRTRPIRLNAITWKEYEAQSKFPPPPRRTLEVNDKLTTRKLAAKQSRIEEWPSGNPSLASQSLVNEALTLSKEKGERYFAGAWG